MNTEDMKLEFILERLYCFYIVKAKAAPCEEIKKFTDTEQWSLKLCLRVCPHLILISQKK